MGAADPRPSQPVSTAADAQKIVDGTERVMRDWQREHPEYMMDGMPEPLVEAVRGYLTVALGLVSMSAEAIAERMRTGRS